MTQHWNTTFRLTLCAMALAGTAVVSAQTQPAPQATPEAPRQGQAPHPAGKTMHKSGPHAGTYATPQQHEAAAVAGERRKGTGPANPPGAQQGTEFERNALRRCEVFKTNDDRHACVERVRQPQLSGSIQGGGVIREYTQTVQVPANPATAPTQYNAPPAQHPAPPVQYLAPGAVPQPHMARPPVEPIRK